MTADLPVKEIMTREVCTVSKDESVLNASRKMIECGVGSVVVVEDSKPVGIVTERDIITKVVARNRVPADVLVEEIMSYPVITVSPNTSTRDAGTIMLKKGIRRLPVINGDELVGIVTDTDLLSYSIDLGEYMGLIREEQYVVDEPEIGKCEICGRIAELRDADGMRVCEDCYETL
ncbi:CBS domain-containing protein [Geoglobus acetivorans]|uniref:Signal transduction protein with CBS domain n=1 Tax=Geoglobus acetivorans TaxID=565033 RepID=A0A0A7GGV0_GEOAI|nr:signal transduction protein with CBS domain [Geoglobus acetivorans]